MSLTCDLLRYLPLCGLVVACATWAAVANERERTTLLPELPEGLASFGAAVLDGSAYVYSGHIGQAHAHSVDNLSQRFQRLKLASAKSWETLAPGPALQSAALVTEGKYLYRVGGLSARNRAGEAEDLHSVASVDRYDPATDRWHAMPALPEPRSSHDACVLNDQIYVAGGWQLGSDGDWHTTVWRLDLTRDDARWESVATAPFQRRALALAPHNGKVYALGGMQPDAGPTVDVHAYDPPTNTWQAGPPLPGKNINGFGCAACSLAGQLYVSVMDGTLYRLSSDGQQWTVAGRLDPGRFFHRLAPVDDDKLLVIGGAAEGGHLTRVELLRPQLE